MSALAALQRAREAGVTVFLQDSRVTLAAGFPPCVELLGALREHKAGIVEILSGSRCRRCSQHLAWPGPVGVTYADGTAECMPCADREVGQIMVAAGRAVTSPKALADPAEMMLQGDIT